MENQENGFELSSIKVRQSCFPSVSLSTLLLWLALWDSLKSALLFFFYQKNPPYIPCFDSVAMHFKTTRNSP